MFFSSSLFHMFSINEDTEHEMYDFFGMGAGVCLCLQYLSILSILQDHQPIFQVFFVGGGGGKKMKQNVERKIAEKRNKLLNHFDKWTMNLTPLDLLGSS